MRFTIFLSCLLVLACNNPKKTVMEKDIHSYGNPADIAVKHIALDLNVDFEKKQLVGKAALTVENKTGATELMLDSRGLQVQKVTLGKDEKETTYSFDKEQEFFGSAFHIKVDAKTDLVTVYYSTSPGAEALQWLSPAQTAGGKHPFLFTQSQAILARTWVPCQDGPGNRITYSARIKVPPELLALMSAENPTAKNSTGIYEFNMPQAVPSYLLALAVGDIQFKSLGKRSGVYAELSLLDRSVYELDDTEKMIDAAEKLYGPYRWGRYDLIVLPPSFPFGGMENPRLTFATPTILAGDRSLVSLVAHELAHSWSGNLVTNATWNDFWLNEGFTTYFERRISESLYGRAFSEMEAVLALQELNHSLDEFGRDSADTKLALNLAGRNPDDGVSDIAYEKGYSFIRLMEETFGREKWDNFLRTYFDKHAFQTMTTKGFLEYLRAELIKGDKVIEEKLKIDTWVYNPGLPDNCPKPQSDAFSKVDVQITAWSKNTPAEKLDTKGWVTQQWIHFLRNLPKTLTVAQMKDLDKALHFTKSGNSEIQCEWLQTSIVNRYAEAYPALEKFLTTVGRRKFLKPLYQKLAESPEGMALANKIYAKARPGYHSVSTGTIDGILKFSALSGQK